MKSVWIRLFAILMAFSLVAAACGDDDDDGGSTSTEDAGDTADGGDDGGDATDDGGDATDDSADTTDDSGDTADDGGDDEAMAAGCDATVPGTEIRYAPYAPNRGMDTPYSSAWGLGGTTLINIYDTLVNWDADTHSVSPNLAEMTTDDGGLTWIMTIQDGISFDDGTPFDAAAVVASVERFRTPEPDQTIINTAGGHLINVESMEATGPLEVTFTMKQPWATFDAMFAGELGFVVNVNAIGDDPVGFAAAPPPESGVGPYILESWTPGEEAILKARDNYWAGPVCVETVRVLESAAGAITGFPAAYEALKNGDLDATWMRDPKVWPQVYADGAADPNLIEKGDGGGIMFNMRADSVTGGDDNLREAIMLALDPEVLNDRVYEGSREIGKSIIIPASDKWTDAVVQNPTDPELAKQILADNGLEGTTVRVLCNNSPLETEQALTAEALLEAVGLTVEVSNIPSNEQIGQIIAGDYDIACWSWSAGDDTGVEAFLRNLRQGVPTNRQGYEDPEMEAALDAAMAASTPDEINAALAAVANLWNAQNAGAFYFYEEQGLLVAPTLKGVKKQGRMMFSFAHAYYEG